MKKIFIILSVILIIVAVGIGIYFAWQKSREILNPPDNNQQLITDNQQLENSQKKLKIISDQPAFDYFVNQNQIYYFNQGGQILKIVDGGDEIISDRIFDNLQSVKSSKDGAKIIVKYRPLNIPQFEVFDLGKNVWQSLSGASGVNILAADFSSDGSKIAYLEEIKNSNSSIANLSIKNLNDPKQKITKILSFNQKDYDIKWIDTEHILLIPYPSYLANGEIWKVNINKKIMELFSSGFGLMLNWPDNGGYGLKFNVAKNQNNEGRLNLIDATGAIKANLTLFNSITLANKCLSTPAKIYCAVPLRYTANRVILPDDYLKKAAYSDDRFYEVGIDENSILEIPLSSKSVIDAIRLSLLENALLFINRYDNKVYRLEL